MKDQNETSKEQPSPLPNQHLSDRIAGKVNEKGENIEDVVVPTQLGGVELEKGEEVIAETEPASEEHPEKDEIEEKTS